jgi:hypothetical protein
MVIASSNRSFGGEKESTSMTPIRYGRLLHAVNERRQVWTDTTFPGIRDDRREQNMLAALERITIDAKKCQQT